MLKLLFKLLITLLALAAALALWQRGQLQVLALQRIDPLPEARALAAQHRYAEAAEYLGFFMEHDYVGRNPEAQALWREIGRQRGSWRYQIEKAAEGVLLGSSDETAGQVASVISDFLVVGDVRDLAIQVWRYSRDKETDAVLAALATLGIAASGAQLLSGAGTAATAGAASPALAGSTSAKQGIATLKTLRKLGQLPDWLGDELIRAAKAAARTGKLDSAGTLLQSVKTLGKTPGGLRLLRHSGDAASLQRMARFADAFAPHGATLYRIGGDAALRAGGQARRLGKSSIVLAATYGRRGLRVLDDLGAPRFVKYAARAAKIGWKGDFPRLLSRWLLTLPQWLLAALAMPGLLVWLPRKRRPARPLAQEPRFP